MNPILQGDCPVCGSPHGHYCTLTGKEGDDFDVREHCHYARALQWWQHNPDSEMGKGMLPQLVETAILHVFEHKVKEAWENDRKRKEEEGSLYDWSDLL